MKPLFVPACVFTDVYHKRIWRITGKYVFFFPTTLVIHDYVILSPKKNYHVEKHFCFKYLVTLDASRIHQSCFVLHGFGCRLFLFRENLWTLQPINHWSHSHYFITSLPEWKNIIIFMFLWSFQLYSLSVTHLLECPPWEFCFHNI